MNGQNIRIRLKAFDHRILDASTREAEVLRLAREEGLRPFDLARGPLVRTRLLRVGPREHVLLLTLHHVISDGWSIGILFRELATAYAAIRAHRDPGLPALALQYADYAVWQRRWLEGGEGDLLEVVDGEGGVEGGHDNQPVRRSR